MEYAKIFQPFHELGKKLFVTQLHVGFGQTVALTMFNLAWKMSKDNNQSLWWAIIGMTDQLLHHKISRDQYVTCFAQVQGSFTLFIVFTIILSVSYLSHVCQNKLQDLGHILSHYPHQVQQHVSRLNNYTDSSNVSINNMKLKYSNELRLDLYRHWSLMESLQHSIYTAARYSLK